VTRLEFFIPGEPVAKGRPRVRVVKGRPMLYTPEETRVYEATVFGLAGLVMRGMAPTEAAVSVALDVLLPVPASWSKRKRADALQGLHFAKSRPDSDNYLKAVLDGMNGVVYVDDSQAVRVSAQKRYAEAPGVHVVVCTLEDMG